MEPRGPVSQEHSPSDGLKKWLAEFRLVTPLCVSFGCASSDEIGQNWTWDQLFALADKRMYEAKDGAK